MYVLKISKSNFSKPIVFLEARKPLNSTVLRWNFQFFLCNLTTDAHAREWITSAVATFTINELLNGPQTNISKYLDDFDVYVLPFLNPDGFVYTHTTVWFQQFSSHWCRIVIVSLYIESSMEKDEVEYNDTGMQWS